MNLDSFLFFTTFNNIRNKLPDYTLKSMSKLIPAFFISSLLEIFGLVALFPVINVIMDPSIIDKSDYMKFIYYGIGFENSNHFVLFLMSAITLLFIIKNLSLFLIYKMQSDTAFNLSGRIAYEKYTSYLNKPYQFHAENNSANLLRNFVQIPTELISYSVLPFFNIINEIFILSIITVGIAIYDPLLFLTIIFFTIPFFIIYDRVYRNKLKHISYHYNISHGGIYRAGMQSMEGFREIVVFNKKDFFKSVFKGHLDIFSKTSGDSYLMKIFSPKIVETVAVIAIFFIFVFGFWFGKDIASLAQFLIVFSIAAYRIIPSLNKMILSFNYIKGSAYVFDYFEKSDFSKKNSGNISEFSEQKIIFKKKLEIKNLSFNFNNRTEKILKEINITIQKSKSIGIIGPSGSGKTTLLNILLRLYEEQEGGIFIDDVKIDRSKIVDWYKIVSYVPQNTILIDGTIAENIAFGIEKSEMNLILLNDVMEKSLLKGFVESLPDGYNAKIGEKGIKISGGQRQRIGIARALYHEGEILIFDEATSSLDYETEKMLTESIDNISRKTDLTVIIVAHRHQTLQFCDQIFRLENGSISGVVTYGELINNSAA